MKILRKWRKRWQKLIINQHTIKIENLDYDDIFHLREALAEKGAKLLNQTPTIFNEIIGICENILEKEE